MASSLLIDIARCECVRICVDRARGVHPCSETVLSQPYNKIGEYQVPEPWSGHLETAPILFLGSHPGISVTEDFPRWSWTDEEISDYFANRFGGGRKTWIANGTRFLESDGNHSARPVSYWSEALSQAREILDREPVPGADYALSEVVHCKLNGESGLKAAIAECSTRYLRRVLAASAAKAVIVFGKHAATAVSLELGLPVELIQGPVEIEGRRRFISFLGAPGSNKVRKLTNCLSERQLSALREFVQKV